MSILKVNNKILLTPQGQAVEVSESGVVVNSLSITENGEYAAPSGTAYSPINVNVPGIEQGTITVQSASQSIDISCSTSSRVICVFRPDLDTYVTPNNPATSVTLGGIMATTQGYRRESASLSQRYFGMSICATTGYTGYTLQGANVQIIDGGIRLTPTGSLYKFQPDINYLWYAF